MCCDGYRPLVQQKLDVLGKVGLSKDNFSNADTKYMQVMVTRCHSLGDKCVSSVVTVRRSEWVVGCHNLDTWCLLPGNVQTNQNLCINYY